MSPAPLEELIKPPINDCSGDETVRLNRNIKSVAESSIKRLARFKRLPTFTGQLSSLLESESRASAPSGKACTQPRGMRQCTITPKQNHPNVKTTVSQRVSHGVTGSADNKSNDFATLTVLLASA